MITLGIVAVGVVRESRKLSARAPICRAHCAVIFAIAQLSCMILATAFLVTVCFYLLVMMEVKL